MLLDAQAATNGVLAEIRLLAPSLEEAAVKADDSNFAYSNFMVAHEPGSVSTTAQQDRRTKRLQAVYSGRRGVFEEAARTDISLGVESLPKTRAWWRFWR